ncbi:hypothetical protein DP73_10785 [Desulfosporosinus sp. HMP52]|uniref:hypothetical protein n=1 Tax=Desulfosporosinus sp. HMP52 TaxID=1487923 RepID=UPI00051FD1E4|nr:hypothetical protein [Desulfosporosinus sp. HMP52]KGK89061.1 hypothetical protein DP73_10785 [Desulfosporosinus sp. HMP52]
MKLLVRKILIAILMITALSFVGGCGSSQTSSSSVSAKTPEATMEAYHEALSKKNYEKMWSMHTDRLKSGLGGYETFVSLYEENKIPPPMILTPLRKDISDQRAVIEYVHRDDGSSFYVSIYELIKINGSWKINRQSGEERYKSK